ncbi:MAG: hypothetical protein QF391_15440, partial [Myxococcota bacterium]|nr:hypothetical protein [Myxococcota bacterium]
FRFEQTWSLRPAQTSGRTRFGLHLATANSVAVVGGIVDRFGVRRLTARYADEKLCALRSWCERPASAPSPPPIRASR